MTSILSLLEDAASTPCTVELDDGRSLQGADVWASAHRTAVTIERWVPRGLSVAVVLDNSVEAIELLLACWLADRTFVSLPLPSRAQDLSEYLAFLTGSAALAGSAVVGMPDAYASMLDAPPVVGYSAIAEGTMPVTHVTPPETELGAFVQFSSGSTSQPTGIVLDLDMIGANVEAILARLSPSTGDAVCSWLPLSHDMGLVGMLLTSFAGAGRRWTNGGHMVLLRPEQFLADPLSWLRSCAETGATITAAPDFALRMVTSRLTAYPDLQLDLSRLRTCVVGAERVRHETLLDFTAAIDRLGGASTIPCAAYGMAEATLAVTMQEPATRWQTHQVDGQPVVLSGSPVAGVDISIDAPTGAIGELMIDGPSVSRRRLGQPDEPSGSLRTKDLGFLAGSDIGVVSRTDEVVNLAGRRVHLPDIDDAAAAVPGVKSGTAVALPTPHHDGYLVTIECKQEAGPADVVGAVRRRLAAAFGIAPSDVITLAPGTTPKTPSGKPQRRRTAALVGSN